MRILQEKTAFDIISTFGKIPDYYEKEKFIYWLEKAGLWIEARELESLSVDDFYDLFTYYMNTIHPEILH